MQREEFLQAVRQAGIVGQGGAGFPSHVKYAAQVEIIIANGCECEPLLGGDVYLLEHDGAEVVEALCELIKQCGAKRGIVAIKKKHARVINIFRPLAEKAGLELALLDDFYPAGDEHVLVHEVTGRTVPPLGLPSAVGTMVTNIGTLRSLADSLKGKPLTRRVVTVTGAVRNAGIIDVPLGISVEECIEACGGTPLQDYALILGGPMMGPCILRSSAKEGRSHAVISKTSGSIIVLPAQHSLVTNAALDRDLMRRRAQCACIQCRLCTEMCPRFLLGHDLEPHRIMRAFATDVHARPDIMRQAMLCCECGACEKVACPMGLAPRQINAVVKQELRALAEPVKPNTELATDRAFWRAHRKIPTARLADRLGLGAYRKLALPFRGTLEPEIVRIALRQHIGAPAIACCAVGDTVQAGAVIGEIPEGALGARIHASVTGTVLSVDSHICIRRMS